MIPFMTMAKEIRRAGGRASHDLDGRPPVQAQTGKLVIYVSADQKNGGAQGVGDGAQEGAKAMEAGISAFLDGQAPVPGAFGPR